MGDQGTAAPWILRFEESWRKGIKAAGEDQKEGAARLKGECYGKSINALFTFRPDIIEGQFCMGYIYEQA